MKDYRKFVWDCALEYLSSRADMNSVRKHMSLDERTRPRSFNEVYNLFLETLSNRQGMPNTIGDVDNLKAVFFDFDHLKTLSTYSNWENLFLTIQRDVKPRSAMDIEKPKSFWVVFCKGSISGANYLKKYASLTELMSYIEGFDSNVEKRIHLPLMMKDEIFGFGFPLACGFLKELGFSNFSKPDTHLIDIFTRLRLSDKTQTQEKLNLDVFKTVSIMAEEVGETPHAVDKAFWLIGSGNLHLDDVKFKTNKDEFIESVRTRSGVKTEDLILETDSRLVGTTAENIFLSLLNQRGIYAHSFDSAGFDGIAFDIENKMFKIGKSPFYVQIKCRGSNTSEYNPQGHNHKIFDKILATAEQLKIPESSLYFVVGFFRNRDIRDIVFFIIPFSSLPQFEKNEHYRFSVSNCQEVIQGDQSIIMI